jgi:hypothetical protein
MPGAAGEMTPVSSRKGEEIEMTGMSQFLLHSFWGRVVLVALFLILSLLFASLMGWLPSLH